jgi:hypothetical protein
MTCQVITRCGRFLIHSTCRSPHIRSVFSVPLKWWKEDRHLHDDDDDDF